MKEQGHPFKSKPHRFRCQNGGYALVETELSSFINPWTRKLEFIICQHTVLRVSKQWLFSYTICIYIALLLLF